MDPVPLVRSVRQALQRSAQIGLPDVIANSPITYGLAELITYMSLDDVGFTTLFDDTARDTVGWTDQTGIDRRATLPRVIYARNGSAGGSR